MIESDWIGYDYDIEMIDHCVDEDEGGEGYWNTWSINDDIYAIVNDLKGSLYN